MNTTQQTCQTLTQQLATCDQESGWEYAPFTGQDGQEIPAYQIFDHHGNGMADTNEAIADPQQWEIAMLLAAAPQLFTALKGAVAALNAAPRFHVAALDRDSYTIAALCDRALAAAGDGKAAP